MARRTSSYGQLPRLLRSAFLEEHRFRCGLVVEKNDRGDEVLSEERSLAPNYITWIRTGFPDVVGAHPKTLLYLMLRHSALLEEARAGLEILRQRNQIDKRSLYERELVKVTSDEPTVHELLDRPVAGVTAGRTLREHLRRARFQPGTPEEQIVDDYRDALGELEALPTAELERLFTETLDVCAYRVDAWVTSRATQRLASARARRPAGAYVGAYGWVENLKPFPASEREEVPIEGERPASAFTHNGGYVYAPSMAHGAAAAVLRNAYMTRAGEQKSPYAVNLSSARVRTALWLLDTVREGQVLGASLGYLFERGLHERQLDRFIDEFRAKYPIAANRLTPSGEPVESIAARNVVDGYALLQDWKANGTAPWTDIAPPPGVLEVVRAVDEALDALADLLTAESVFQLVSGSLEGAGASLDAMARGAHPPEPDIARWFRGGTSVTHRVALVLGAGPGPGDGWPDPTPRAWAEPLLDAWVGRILGDPSRVVCLVEFRDGPGRRVTLRELGLRALDVIALAKGDAGGGTLDAELDRRVSFAAAAPGAAAVTAIRYDPPDLAADERSFVELLEIARAIHAVLAGSRALTAQDLLVPEEAADLVARGADPMMGELRDRADAAVARLAVVLANLEAALTAAPSDPRAALRAAAALGVAGAFPPPQELDLAARAASVRDELRRRRDEALRETDPVRRVRAVFGRDFLLLPRFVPGRRAELTQALANGPALGDDPDATLDDWLAGAARVRATLADWRLLSLYRRTLERPEQAPSPMRIVQLPHAPDARWVGLRFDAPGQRPPAGRVSVALVDDAPPAPDAAWAGLLLDEWVELIPNAAEDAGVVFHYDRPGAEAPQAVLVAVPPHDEAPWSVELLERILVQTLEGARLRGFDGEWKMSGGEIGHAFYGNPWLPMILMADNAADETIATSFEACTRPEGE